jgi:hypothetical protein
VERKRQPLDPPLSQDLSELCSEGGWVYSITSMMRPPHLTLHAVGGFKLAKVLAILITVFYTDKQMAKVRRKTECLS